MTNEQLWTDADTEALRGIGQFHGSPHNLLGRRAADEIERLRGKLDFANREPPHCPTCSCGQHEPGCSRAHPHENMNQECQRLTEVAKERQNRCDDPNCAVCGPFVSTAKSADIPRPPSGIDIYDAAGIVYHYGDDPMPHAGRAKICDLCNAQKS